MTWIIQEMSKEDIQPRGSPQHIQGCTAAPATQGPLTCRQKTYCSHCEACEQLMRHRGSMRACKIARNEDAVCGMVDCFEVPDLKDESPHIPASLLPRPSILNILDVVRTCDRDLPPCHILGGSGALGWKSDHLCCRLLRVHCCKHEA